VNNFSKNKGKFSGMKFAYQEFKQQAPRKKEDE
jgi:hypothetical protein